MTVSCHGAAYTVSTLFLFLIDIAYCQGQQQYDDRHCNDIYHNNSNVLVELVLKCHFLLISPDKIYYNTCKSYYCNKSVCKACAQ